MNILPHFSLLTSESGKHEAGRTFNFAKSFISLPLVYEGGTWIRSPHFIQKIAGFHSREAFWLFYLIGAYEGPPITFWGWCNGKTKSNSNKVFGLCRRTICGSAVLHARRLSTLGVATWLSFVKADLPATFRKSLELALTTANCRGA